MSKKYSDLYALIDSEPDANRYFNSLPVYVKDQIETRASGVNSLSSLQDYAENLLRGDN